MNISPSRWIALGSSLLLIGAIFYLLKRQDGFATLIEIWQRTDRPAFLFGLVIMTGLNTIGAWRMKIVMAAERLPAKLTSLMRIQIISQFMAHGAPISALAELARATMLKLRFDLGMGRSIRIILYERICGALGTMVCGIFTTAGQLFSPVPNSLLFAQAALWAVGTVGMFIVIWASRKKINTGIELFDRIAVATLGVGHLLRDPRIASSLLFLSILQIAGLSLLFLVLAAGMHINVSPLQVVLFMPFIFFISSLPIFYLGWGAREAIVIATIGHASGLSVAEAVAISVGYGVIVFAASLPGLIFWVLRPSMRKVARTTVPRRSRR